MHLSKLDEVTMVATELAIIDEYLDLAQKAECFALRIQRLYPHNDRWISVASSPDGGVRETNEPAHVGQLASDLRQLAVAYYTARRDDLRTRLIRLGVVVE